MRAYHGTRLAHGAIVTVADDGVLTQHLPPRHDLRNHSPTGFEWGYNGSGPAQLALALCAHVVGDARAILIYQRVKDKLVAPIKANDWRLDAEEIIAAVEQAEGERAEILEHRAATDWRG